MCIYVSDDWIDFVSKARKHKKFEVVKMQQKDFFNSDAMAEITVNRENCNDCEDVKWLKYDTVDLKQTTELSKHIWTLKNKNIDFRIEWTVLKKTKSYSNITKRCQLCLWEKYFIIMSDKAITLNKRSELLNKCRNSSKFLLKTYRTRIYMCIMSIKWLQVS